MQNELSFGHDFKFCLIFYFFLFLFQAVLTPQNSFYEKLAKDCVENGVGVDLFLFPNAYIDVATIGSVATLTGGQIYRYSYFKVLHPKLQWNLKAKQRFVMPRP